MTLWIREGSRNQRKWRGLEWTWYQWGASRAKGWYTLFAAWRRWDTEIKLALGGEDNMLQFELGVPLLGKAAIGVRVPSLVTEGWIHHRREFGIELHGLSPTLLIGWDDQMGDMSSYYRRSYLDQGKPLPSYLNRVTLHPGWRLSARVRLWRLKDRLLGKIEIEQTPIRTYEDLELALPEGVYHGKVVFTRERIFRRHWRTYHDDLNGEWRSEEWLPFPGKGENSWDCGDDGIKEHSTTLRRIVHDESLCVDSEDVTRVIASTIAYVLRQRGRYGGPNWKPEGIGVMR